MTFNDVQVWVQDHQTAALVIAAAVALLAWRKRDAIKAWVQKIRGGDPQSDGVSPTPVVMRSASGIFQKFSISDFLSALSQTPLMQKLEMDRDALVRTLFSFWIVKMSDWVRKSKNFTPEQQKQALDALWVLSPLIQVGGGEAVVPDNPPLPPPAPLPAPPEPPVV